jgi:hypothetical protein
MISDRAVNLTIPHGLVMTRDGQTVSLASTVSDNGFYTLAMAETPTAAVFTFRIIIGPTNSFFEYTPPIDYFIHSVFLNDEEVILRNEQHFTMSEDGTYQFIMQRGYFDEDAEINDNFDVVSARIILKTTPPVVFFEGVNEQMVAVGSVQYWVEEPDVELRIVRNSRPFSAAGTLTQVGNYRIIATDLAGNESIFDLRVQSGGRDFTVVWVGLMGVTLPSGLGGYLFWNRTHLRVR